MLDAAGVPQHVLPEDPLDRRDELRSALAVLGIIFGAAYLLWLYQRTMFGKLENPKNDRLIASAYQAWLQGHLHREPGLQPGEDPAFPPDQFYNPPEEQIVSTRILRESADERRGRLGFERPRAGQWELARSCIGDNRRRWIGLCRK